MVMWKLVLVLLLCLLGGELFTVHCQTHEELSMGHQSLTAVIEDMAEEVEDLEEDVEDGLGEVEQEIEDFREEMEETLENEINTLKNSTQAKLEEIGGMLHPRTSEQDETQNCTQAIRQYTQETRSELQVLETTLNEVKYQTSVFANHTEKDLQDVKQEVVNSRDNLYEVGTMSRKALEARINGLENKLCEVVTVSTNTRLEIKEELTSLQRDMNSTLYILQELKNQLTTMRQENLIERQNILRGSCSELHPTSPSGYYWLRGSPERVYCDMDRQSCGCGSPWGWMRVANIDMTDPNQQCPQGFRLRPGTSTRMCAMTAYSDSGGCTSIVFPTHNVQYSRVCGRVKAYQDKSSNGFQPYFEDRSRTIDDLYVEGVSITHGQSPRNHIWTFAAALDEIRSDVDTCPCTKTDTTYTGAVPPFIGNDYFCDTGSRQRFKYVLYTDDPLWDGEGCGPTSSCCQFNSPPWFCKELPQPTTDDIEVRVCRDQQRSNEDIPFDLIELYVH